MNDSKNGRLTLSHKGITLSLRKKDIILAIKAKTVKQNKIAPNAHLRKSIVFNISDFNVVLQLG